MIHLFDHVARVHRVSESVNALREKVNTLTPLPDTERMALDTSPFRSGDEGAGQFVEGSAEGFMRATADVQEGDVLEVISGPEAPRTLRVISASRPRGHHCELVMEMYRGKL